MRYRPWQFRISTVLIAMAVASVAFAFFNMPTQHPDKVRQILKKLPSIADDASLEAVIEIVTDSLGKRTEVSSDYLARREVPRYYMNIHDDYRLAIDFTRKVTEAPEIVVFGSSTFNGAQVEKYDNIESSWNVIYPMRTKTGMKYSASGR